MEEVNYTSKINEAAFENIIREVEESSDILNNLVYKVVGQYSEPLDKYIQQIDSMLSEGKEVSDTELEDVILNLATLLYFVSEGQEKVGIKEDIAKLVRAELYNISVINTKGTTSQKLSTANLDCKQETVVAIIYQRAYKLIKMKVETGQELLVSAKKILSRRIATYSMLE